MKRVGLVVSVFLLAVISMPSTASAAQIAVDLGGFAGTAQVGKGAVCEEDGGGYVWGAGLGMPFFARAKWANWRLDGVVVSPLYGSGYLQLCGKLGPIGQAPNSFGASCGWTWGPTKFYDGQGTILYPWAVSPVTIHLWDVGAKYDRGTLFGRAAIDPNKNQGTFFFRKWEGEGSPECIEKWGDEKSGGEGATTWNLTAGYHVNPLFSTGLSDWYDHPATCKDSSNPACPYETKQ